MNINKDEAAILSAAISEFKFQLSEKKNISGLFDNLVKLENKLESYSKDSRRFGRTSQNDWSDVLKRFSKKKYSPFEKITTWLFIPQFRKSAESATP